MMPGCSGLDEVAGAGGEGAFPRERGNTGRGLGGQYETGCLLPWVGWCEGVKSGAAAVTLLA